MPWFRIHSKPYLLSVEERQRQLRVQKERRGHSITRPSESTDTVIRPSSSRNDTYDTAFSDDARFEPMARFISIFCYAEWTTDV
ncbi:hypothetical protein Goshw_022572 [Gossypium schwendimanii]|uniref:Uncharacterized protein n=1 Tax=Gossypium schwendimanii TaxID=34291 RepID=A0A7J9MWU5_GOSSC|nr:hypothetical protein [Gossypium schwendimanii]